MDPKSLDDLIRRAQRRDASAYDALVGAFGGRIFGFVFRLTGSRDDADDLTQEVFLRIVRTIQDYRHDGRFTAWVFRIAVNLVRDRRRSRSRQPTALDRPQWGDDAAQGEFGADLNAPEAPLELAEDVDRLTAAMARMPEAERDVLVMRHYSGMSFREIADMMGTPLGTALARAHRGLARLRGMLEGSEDDAVRRELEKTT